MKLEIFPENASEIDPPAHLDVGAPQVTVEAIMYELREHGLDALKASNARERLGVVSRKQHREILARLIRLRPHCPKISDELLVYIEGLGQ